MNNKLRAVAWPSGLKLWIKAPVSSETWVEIPPVPGASLGGQSYSVVK